MGIWKCEFLSRLFREIRTLAAPWGIEDFEPEVIELLTKIDDCFIEEPNLEGYIKSFSLETEADKYFFDNVIWASSYWVWNFQCKKLHSNLDSTVTLLFYPRYR